LTYYATEGFEMVLLPLIRLVQTRRVVVSMHFASNVTPQVKEARNRSQIFNRKSISRNTTHRLSYHPQAMLTGVKRWKAKQGQRK